MPYPSLIARLAASLLQTLPGAQAHQRLSPALRFPPHLPMPDQRKARQSAVLLLLYPSIDAQWHIALMQRNPNSRHHAAQISLPGGGIEPQDADLNATALRETSEEFGIDTGSIQVLGALSPIYIPVSNAKVQPFVGYCPQRPNFIPDPREVAAILEIPLAELLDPQSLGTARVESGLNLFITVPCFRLQGHVVWGATAMMLSEFIAIATTE